MFETQSERRDDLATPKLELKSQSAFVWLKMIFSPKTSANKRRAFGERNGEVWQLCRVVATAKREG